MSYVESDEQQMLRKQVHEIGRKYGREYYVKNAREGTSPNELWDEVAKQGFIGVNTSEEYGGGGLGIYELAIVCEELAAAGCPLLLLLVSPAICWRGSDPSRRHRDPGSRRERHVRGVRSRFALGYGAHAAHRTGQPRDDPQLRLPAHAGSAEVVLAGRRRNSIA